MKAHPRTTYEVIVPMPDTNRATQVIFPKDITAEEWNRVTDVVLERTRSEDTGSNSNS